MYKQPSPTPLSLPRGAEAQRDFFFAPLLSASKLSVVVLLLATPAFAQPSR